VLRRKLVGQDGNEYQVVDTENDLKDDKGKKRYPRGWIAQPVEMVGDEV
jgi:hypothetical protein